MTKVLFDHEIFIRQVYGGISRYYREIIPRLSAIPGLRVSAYTGLHMNRYGLERSTGTYDHFLGARRPRGKAFSALAKIVNRPGLRAFAAYAQPQVYHQTGYFDLLPRRKVRRVITLHDLIWNRFPDKVHPGDFITPRRELIHAADAVICISESTRRDAIELLGLPAERTSVVHHANSLTLPPPRERPHAAPYLLFVGHRAGYKNFDLVLQAMAASPRLRSELALVCFGPAPADAERARIAELGLNDRVVFDARKDDETLVALYAHAQAFVYPSLCEGFGIPLLEAMHYACPVVAARASCFPEIAADAALYFDPASPDDLAARLEQAAFDGPTRQRLREAGPKREATFSWDDAARKIAAVYRTLAPS